MKKVSRALTPEENLKGLEEEYKGLKSNEKTLKANIKKVGDTIKQLMLENGLDSFGSLKLTSTPKEEFNELQAIEILRTNLNEELFRQVVKTKEYVDEDVLESLIYNHTIEGDLLAPCITTGKIVHTLRIGKEKK